MCPLEPFPKDLGERLAEHCFFAAEVVVDGRGRDLGVSHKLLDGRVGADFREHALGGTNQSRAVTRGGRRQANASVFG